MEKFLNQFQNDNNTREAVKEFLLKQLDLYALDAVYNKEDTAGIADAKNAIIKAFSELHNLYSPDIKPEVRSIR